MKGIFMAKIIGIGNALVDSEFVLNDEQLTKTGLTKANMTLASQTEQQDLIQSLNQQNITASKLASGGSSANSIFVMASLGSETFYACRVADDDMGHFYVNDLKKVGVKTSPKSIVKDGITGSCMVLVTPDGERTMQTHLGTSAEISENEIDFSQLQGADWLYIEGYLAMTPSVQSAIMRLKKEAKQHNIKVAVSFADPAVVKFAKDGLDTMLAGGVDVVFCNAEEAMLYTGKTDYQSASQALLKVANMAVVTNGAKDTVISYQADFVAETHSNSQITIPTPTVAKILDTNGAGDNYAGAFLHAFANGNTLVDCGKLAGRIAGQVVQQFGARLTVEQYQQIAKNI